MKPILTLIPIIGFSLISCEKSKLDTKETGDPKDHILSAMNVQIATIDLQNPCKVSLITEVGGHKDELLTMEANSRQSLQIGIQLDDDSNKIRVALGDEETAISQTLNQNIFAKRGRVFYHDPQKVKRGRYIIMESPPGESPSIKVTLIIDQKTNKTQ